MRPSVQRFFAIAGPSLPETAVATGLLGWTANIPADWGVLALALQ